MNWDDERKRSKGIDPEIMSLMDDNWIDAWRSLYKKEEGYTYDAKSNPMLRGNLRRRFDRFLLKFRNSSLDRVEESVLIGLHQIPGIQWEKSVNNWSTGKPTGETRLLPVLPSDHYGLKASLSIK
mmetsp:Transcript_16352/g.36793  ORF Transcript_16352/g.36793 Transcript_16352/m.36793 type:complete len:125 (-) Transcript_16352:44-418(-)